ncbi:unnamed protein product [Amoebophrya sp. A120]|nr:unnamed protein product [Amoebophrya sp. A120]|eukprot:GSA120T00014879001.1
MARSSSRTTRLLGLSSLCARLRYWWRCSLVLPFCGALLFRNRTSMTLFAFATSNGTTGTVVPAPTPSVANPNAPNCAFGRTAHLQLGKRAVLCVFLGPTSDTNPAQSAKKLVFSVKVDEYSSLTLSGAQELTNAVAEKNIPVYSWVAAANTGTSFAKNCGAGTPDTTNATSAAAEPANSYITCPQLYRNGQGLLVPFVSLVINIEDGNIKSLVFDNICPNCSDNQCLPSQQHLDADYAPVGSPRSSSKTCSLETAVLQQAQDFKIFVTWAGTDKNGRHCKSSAFRFSRFAGATLSDMWSFTQDNYHSSFG